MTMWPVRARPDVAVVVKAAAPDGIFIVWRERSALMREIGVLKLKGVVQHYDWGGLDFIPGLVGLTNSERKPCAELWIGAHPKAPSTTQVAGQTIPLDQLIAEAPESVLGPSASAQFDGKLPYLFKVLDVAKMLSIQVHPTREQAQDGYAREDAAGIGLQAGERNYKDENHKPEVAVALTDFRMLHGFRPLEQIAETLRDVPELHSIMPDFTERLARAGAAVQARQDLLRDLYQTVMTIPQERVDALLNALVARLAASAPTDKNDPNYWAARAVKTYPPVGGHRDRGIFSIYLLNLVHLRPGQGTFQPAGLLHAYLEGVNVELMANSDNVLRGGLTPKHVDVPELLRILSFTDSLPRVLDGELSGDSERVYRTASDEFEVSRIDLAAGKPYLGKAAHGPDSIIVLDGAATLTARSQNIPLVRGAIVFVPFGTEYSLRADGATARLFKASVPGAR
jgi:mannose-6-phosphate isomerase class I